jgi:hypothetical protein
MNTAQGWFNDEIIEKATNAPVRAMEAYVLVYVAKQPAAHL